MQIGVHITLNSLKNACTEFEIKEASSLKGFFSKTKINFFQAKINNLNISAVFIRRIKNNAFMCSS